MSTHRCPTIRHSLRAAAVLLVGALAVACGNDERERLRRDLTERIEQVERLSDEKDSLIQDVVANAQFVQAINTEMDRVRRLPRGVRVISRSTSEAPIPVRAYRDSILAQIRDLTVRLDESEARLVSAQSRISTPDGKLAQLIDEYRETIGQMRNQLSAQRAELVSLQEEVRDLKRQVRDVSQERDRYRQEGAEIEERYAEDLEQTNTMYYVARSRSQLKELNIVEESGGGLFGRGKTLVPSRQLNVDDFTPLSKRGDLEITLPNAAKDYLIVSNHNPAYVEPTVRDRTVRGSFRITDPDRFWEQGRYLILVER